MLKYLACVLFSVFYTGSVLALEAPTGQVILTINGNIAEKNSEAGAVFDAAMLDRLPQHTIVSGTPWHNGVRSFRGPKLRDVLALVGAKGRQLKAVALNDFESTLPMEDILGNNVILARWIDEQPLTVRTKGPTFIVYPFDERPEFRSDVYYNRCVWQIKSMTVE